MIWSAAFRIIMGMQLVATTTICLPLLAIYDVCWTHSQHCWTIDWKDVSYKCMCAQIYLQQSRDSKCIALLLDHISAHFQGSIFLKSYVLHSLAYCSGGWILCWPGIAADLKISHPFFHSQREENIQSDFILLAKCFLCVIDIAFSSRTWKMRFNQEQIFRSPPLVGEKCKYNPSSPSLCRNIAHQTSKLPPICYLKEFIYYLVLKSINFDSIANEWSSTAEIKVQIYENRCALLPGLYTWSLRQGMKTSHLDNPSYLLEYIYTPSASWHGMGLCMNYPL